MEVRVTVEGFGTYIVAADKTDELIAWLTKNTVHVNDRQPVKEVVDNRETGRELLFG